ncbi:unnamed protein product, partial [Cylicostephanus goldi]
FHDIIFSAVHQVFPKVCVLDGSPVQPAAVHVQSLDDDEITTEPPSRPGFYGSDNLRVLVERFLVEYYKLYDGEEGNVTRKNLVQAYDQDNEELLAFTVQGLFEDGTFAKPGEVPQLSFFSRSFVVSPRANESIAVISDMLYITGITPARVARYKLMLNKAASNGPAPAPAAPVAPMNPIAQATS